jgi:hypothetical protein
MTRGLVLSLLAAAALAALAALAAWSGLPVWPGYLFAVLTGLCLPLGALMLLATAELTGGAWTRDLGPALRLQAAALPALALLVVPPLLVQPAIWPWAAPPETLSHLVRLKTGYLNEAFFAARAVFYLLAWLALAALLLRTSATRRPRLGAAALIVLALTVSFAAVDWGMSLEPAFSSAVYGWLFATQALVAAYALALLASGAAQGRAALGDLLAAGVVLWAYMTFFQYLVAWTANLPHAAAWYLARGSFPWDLAIWLAALLHGLVPAVALLAPGLRGRAAAQRAAALCVLVGWVLHLAWLVLPAFGPLQAATLAAAGMGAIGVAGIVWLAAIDGAPPPHGRPAHA